MSSSVIRKPAARPPRRGRAPRGTATRAKETQAKGEGQATLDFDAGIARTCATLAQEGAQCAARYGGLRCGSGFEPRASTGKSRSAKAESE